MIEIVNFGSLDGIGHKYTVFINSYGLNENRKVMCHFTHQQKDGLAECLRRAAEALDKRALHEKLPKGENLPLLKEE